MSDAKMTAKNTATPPAPKRGRGRPPSATAARENLHVRATDDQRARWSSVVAALADAAQASGAKQPSESEWIRQGLDAWAEACGQAMALGADPGELVSAALEGHGRVRQVVVRLEDEQRGRALTATEDGILRTLAPSVWERLGRAGALTLPPKQRRG